MLDAIFALATSRGEGIKNNHLNQRAISMRRMAEIENLAGGKAKAFSADGVSISGSHTKYGADCANIAKKLIFAKQLSAATAAETDGHFPSV